MKRILYLTGDLSIPGGIGRMVTMKANWLVNHGYHVVIMVSSSHGSKSFYHIDNRIQIIPVDIDFLTVYNNGTGILGMLKSLADRCKKNKTYISIVSDYLNTHPVDVVFTTGNHADICSIKDGSLKVYEFHFSFQSQIEFMKELPRLSKAMYSIYNWYKRKSLRRYDKVISLTKMDMEYYGNPTNFIVIPNFISIDNKGLVSDCKSKRAISVGRLCQAKGYDYLFKAWKLVVEKKPEWTLDIYGYGYGREKSYQKMIDNLGMQKHIHIHPAVENIAEKYVAASLYILSSRNEGFPLVLPEAMSCGLPVVSFDCNTGPSEIITNGEDGLLVREVGDVEGLAAAILKLLSNDEKRIRMGKTALKNVERFSQDAVMQLWINLIENSSRCN